MKLLSSIVLVSTRLMPLCSRERPAPAPNKVVIDDDGTVHVPAQAVPMSGFLSPEAKACVTQHLRDMQNPQMLAADNGFPRFMNGYLERQKMLYPVDREGTRMAGVHACYTTPIARSSGMETR